MTAGPPLPTPYRPEADAAAACLGRVEGALDWTAVVERASPWLEAARSHPAPFWALETLLREYPISSAEGNALMRLAEALLRVPDRETAIALTAEQLGRAAFDSRHPEDWLGALSARALALSRTMLPGEGGGGLLGRLGAEAVVAIALRAVRLLGQQFVLGESIEAARERALEWRGRHPALRFSYDMLGEGARTAEVARAYFERYLDAVNALAAEPQPVREAEERDGISVKLSALFPRYEDVQRARVLAELVPRAWLLCERAAAAGINLTIDAEESERLELSLEVFEALAARTVAEYPRWRGLGLAVQAYQTRAPDAIEHVVALARRIGLRLMVRLVKGAYWDSEIKRAQVLGVRAYPVYTHKHHTDLSFLACARALFAAPGEVYPQFASHNAGTIAAVLALARDARAPFELQRLHGMGESVYREVLAESPGLPCRVYAPVGEYRDLLAYLVRRLLENGANSSFVHQLADLDVPVAQLLTSPLRVEPRSAQPLPPDLYGPRRRNSAGFDVAAAADRERLIAAYPHVVVERVPDLDAARLGATVAGLQAGFGVWSERTPGERADMLRRAADLLEGRVPEFCGRIVKEARKTWDDAVAEVREAVDYLRYYALEAERVMAPVALPGPTGESNELRLRPRGVWVCISPWNFPLAIFTGQVAAALVTGNAVAAKPAEQTPAVAAAMVDLFHEAGVSRDALALCPGSGETTGAALVADRRIAGVAFTGSVPVAHAIARALAESRGEPARPLVPFIAETGGVNAMIVDSTALPEQVVDAVVASAFRSAGQRCSCLRLLCLQEPVADAILDLLRGAVAELVVGDPSDPATDVGPLIDFEAQRQVARQIAALERRARLVARGRAPADVADSYVVPCIYEIDAVESAAEEIFGPVLQVARWSGDVEGLVGRINAAGYGLTLGVQTRLDARAGRIAAHARVGNVYVNRSMTGAVVGVQPFGGEGLSGTGPKAGGPHYLPRFCSEQTVTVNTAAAGGNVALLSAGP
jgi:RHH-type proline utilization regulon transcriptional repressor/proline dehydrogenase/delta 1-pyrroline-5-carboxylate dehydrogenase